MLQLYPLTHPQKRIWYIEKTFPETAVANIAATVRIKEKVDYEALEQALNYVVRINDAMRTRIIESGSEPMQFFAPYEKFTTEFIDFSEESLEKLYEWDTKSSGTPIPFIDSPLFYFVRFKLSESEGGFFSKIHHFITDAWTEMLLCSQIMTAYRAFCEGKVPDISAFSYIDYIGREQRYLNSEKYLADQHYWLGQFDPLPEPVTLQTKKPSKKTLAARRKSFILSKDDADNIRSFCAEQNITVFTFLMTMLTVYINRITSSNDIVIGTPVLNRLNAKEKQMTGMFISTVPLCFRIDENTRYVEYARNINSSWLSILRHQQYPYDMLQRAIRKQGNQVGENLFEITISYQNAKLTKDLLLWDGMTRWHFSGYQNEPLVIHINDHDDNGILVINYDYNISCFADREIHFIHSHFRSLIEDVLKSPDKPIRSLTMISAEESQRILGFNRTSSVYDRDQTVTALFEQQADRTPDALALIFHDEKISFRELDNRANQLAHKLREKGVGPDDIIAVMLPRSPNLIYSILGILKAGGAFMPIDPSYPPDRIQYMLKNSTAKYVITSIDLALAFDVDLELIIDPHGPEIIGNESSRLPLTNSPDDLIYIIYTSGSTGLPKGVMIKHSGLRAYIHALEKFMYFQPGEAVLSICTIAFDIFIFETIPSLVNGMHIVLADENEQLLPALQKELIIKHNIVKFLGTPVRMKMLLEDPGNEECFAFLKEVMIGGDTFPEPLLKQMKRVLTARIYNGYGPTEITIGATFKDLTDTDEINIGRPIANTKIYILDRHMNMVPIGIPGEMYIGGDGLARGYLNNADLTAEKFVDDPFCPGEKLYRTGDLCRWYPKGEIAFLGRIDSQVKIRGHRVELGEIEKAIRQQPGITDALVIDMPIRGRNALCAYIVTTGSNEFDHRQLRKELFKQLPNFMVPGFFVSLESIPLNSNGKVDRRALPPPDNIIALQQKSEPLGDAVEHQIALIWENILEVDAIGATEDFFELGGDSLDVVSLVTALHSEFGAEITISDIYEMPTIRRQADLIRSSASAPCSSICTPNIVPLQKKSSLRRIYFIHAGNGEISNYLNLCRWLDDDISVYGLRFINNQLSPANFTVNELAAKYLQQIRNIQPHGPYFLAGWCIGGTIAFEMACMLEQAGEDVAFLSLINTLAPQKWKNIAPFTIKTEIKFISSLLGKAAAGNSPRTDSDDMDRLWNSALDLTQFDQASRDRVDQLIPLDAKLAIPDFAVAEYHTLVKYINTIRSMHNARALYYPGRMLKTKLHFFEATINDVIKNKDENIKSWQRYCQLPIERYRLQGDHFSIFQDPEVESLGKIISGILS